MHSLYISTIVVYVVVVVIVVVVNFGSNLFSLISFSHILSLLLAFFNHIYFTFTIIFLPSSFRFIFDTDKLKRLIPLENLHDL